MFPGFASTWVDFVDQNKSLEQTIQRVDRHRAYEDGRNDHAQIEGGRQQGPAPFSRGPFFVASRGDRSPAAYSIAGGRKYAGLRDIGLGSPHRATGGRCPVVPAVAAAVTGPTMSAARDLYLAPPDRKKAHLSKGRSETVAIVQFAIDLLNDPPLHSVSKDDWNTLDLALPDIPHSRDLPAEACSSLYARYCYARKHGGTRSHA